MKKTLVALLLMLVTISAVAADGEITSVEYVTGWQTWFQPFAIYTDQPNYDPAEAGQFTMVTTVPCEMSKAYLYIFNSAGSAIDAEVVTSYFSPCTSGYAQIGFIAPTTPGEYRVELRFRNSFNEPLYTDKGWFNVGATTQCPANYQTNWQTAYTVDNGRVEERQTGTYGNPPQCELTVQSEIRTSCQSGFEAQGNSCVSTTGEPVCGNGVKEAGEGCDLGSGNDVCPSTCDLTCQPSTCEVAPPPGVEPPGGSNNVLLGAGAIVGGVVIITGIALLVLSTLRAR